MMLDPYTFGNSRVSVNLCSILNELNNPRITRKITRFLVNHYYFINTVAESTRDPAVRNRVFKMMKRELQDPFVNSSMVGIPEKVLTHAQNTVLVHMREKLLRNNIRNKDTLLKLRAENNHLRELVKRSLRDESI